LAPKASEEEDAVQNGWQVLDRPSVLLADSRVLCIFVYVEDPHAAALYYEDTLGFRAVAGAFPGRKPGSLALA